MAKKLLKKTIQKKVIRFVFDKKGNEEKVEETLPNKIKKVKVRDLQEEHKKIVLEKLKD